MLVVLVLDTGLAALLLFKFAAVVLLREGRTVVEERLLL